jgi:amino acid transporter
VPRITFALAENGDFPAIFSALHPRFRAPYVSILAFAQLSWLRALLVSFTWNQTLSALARLLYYRLVCASLPVFRPQAAWGGDVSSSRRDFLAGLGASISMLLITGAITDLARHRGCRNA